MKKGTRVFMSVAGFEGEGTTIENESAVVDSKKIVIRVRWDDGTESIECTDDLLVIPEQSVVDYAKKHGFSEAFRYNNRMYTSHNGSGSYISNREQYEANWKWIKDTYAYEQK